MNTSETKKTTLPQELSQSGIGHLVSVYLESFIVDHPNFCDMGNLYGVIVDEVEKALIIKVLERTKGNQSKAAQILGLNRNTLRKKVLEHKIA